MYINLYDFVVTFDFYKFVTQHVKKKLLSNYERQNRNIRFACNDGKSDKKKNANNWPTSTKDRFGREADKETNLTQRLLEKMAA